MQEVEQRRSGCRDTSLRDAAECDQCMVMGIKQHLMGLQQVGSQHKGPAMAELEVSHLQLGSLAADDHPVLRPVELEGFTGGKDQRYKRSFGGRQFGFLLARPPIACKGGNPIIGARVALLHQIEVQLPDTAALLSMPF